MERANSVMNSAPPAERIIFGCLLFSTAFQRLITIADKAMTPAVHPESHTHMNSATGFRSLSANMTIAMNSCGGKDQAGQNINAVAHEIDLLESRAEQLLKIADCAADDFVICR